MRDAHERIDGLGYPNGTHAADVALGARIIAVADAFDAMTRPRVFRDAITPREALLELERCAGTQFDAGRRGDLQTGRADLKSGNVETRRSVAISKLPDFQISKYNRLTCPI